MTTYFQAVSSLVGPENVKGGNTHGPIDKITFLNDVDHPSEETIQAKLTELKNAEPMRVLREERNHKLAKTDWWCASDQTPTKAQLDYRKSLRELPSIASPSLDKNGNLTGVTWPTKPE